MSTTKTIGSGGILWPKSPDGNPFNLEEMPSDLMNAVDHALKILSWQENLSSDEMPKHWMWHLDHELELWFDNLRKKREEKKSSPNHPPTDGELFEEGQYDENIYYTRKLAEMKGT